MINLSIGFLGHVDSGKTSLARALSTTLSTASLDKHPASEERGITLDIGISSFRLGKHVVNIVDCPGHAEFMSSVLAGAEIIQYLIILVDAKEGIQKQTFEAFAIADALSLPTICAINKIDANPDTKKIESQINQICEKAKLNYQIARISAKNNEIEDFVQKLEAFIDELSDRLNAFAKEAELLSPRVEFEHSFKNKEGTIYTGTVLEGELHVKDEFVVIPGSGYVSEEFEEFELKTIETFKEQQESASVGERVGMQLLKAPFIQEKGIICKQNDLISFRLCKCKCRLLKFCTEQLRFGEKISINFGPFEYYCSVYNVGKTESEIYSEEEFENIKAGAVKGKQVILYCVFQKEVIIWKDAKILGIRTNGEQDCRICFSGQVVDILQEDFSIEYHWAQDYECAIEKRSNNEAVIKEIPQFKGEIMLNEEIIENGEEVGTIVEAFGEGKWKARILDSYDQNVQTYVRIKETKSLRIDE